MIRTTSSVSSPPRTPAARMRERLASCAGVRKRVTGCGSCFRRSLASAKARCREPSRSRRSEAKAYLRHPVLGPRLIECAGIVASARAGTAEQIFGGIDGQKLRSCVTLFLRAQPDEPLFQQVLDRYFGGLPDSATDGLI